MHVPKSPACCHDDTPNLRAFDGLVDREWSLDDVLTDHLNTLNVPVLGTLPIGPGRPPVPIGVPAVLNATDAVLSVG
ncbi:hypothetical protein WEI85_24140 [Actinomycetes bacterium KLBMP 9797]